MNPEIFREYDIRGLNEELDDDTAGRIGMAYGTIIRKSFAAKKTSANRDGKKSENTKPGPGNLFPTVAVGMDNRASSPAIAQALIRGITSTCVNVVFVGEVTTPELYYAVHKLDMDGGINVTGSHNPPQYNGFKVLVGRDAIFGKAIQQIRKIAESKKFFDPPAQAKKSEKAKGKNGKAGKTLSGGEMHGNVGEKNIDAIYLQEIASKVKVPRKLKVVVDAGNGMASELGPALLRMLGCDVIELYCEKIPGYPNHIPDPSQEKNVAELKRQVVAQKADIGIAFDGDVDRLGVVDEKGSLLYGDRLLGVLAKRALGEKPGAKIVFEVKCSQALGEYIRSLGGKPIMWKTGHSLIKAKMKEEGAALGGEMSGHMFFALGWYGFDDALLAAAKVIEIVAQSKKKVSEIASEMPIYASSPEYRIDFPDPEKFTFVEKAKKYFSKKHKVVAIDGCRVVFDYGWALIRASNTQPKLIIRMEGNDSAALGLVKEEFLAGIMEFSGKEISLEGSPD